MWENFLKRNLANLYCIKYNEINIFFLLNVLMQAVCDPACFMQGILKEIPLQLKCVDMYTSIWVPYSCRKLVEN